MAANLDSSAPHIHGASHWDEDLVDWGGHLSPIDGNSTNCGRLLFKGEGGLPEVGIWDVTPGSWELLLPADELCHFVHGRAVYKAYSGEVIEIEPGTLVHFKEGWRGTVEVFDNTRSVYMFCQGGEAERTPVLRQPATIADLTDWGDIDEPIDGLSAVSGVLLSREEDGRAESGVWVCTPGTWRCEVSSDEMCHFLSGRCTYTHESGEVIEVEPDTAAYFPQGWRGQCQVHETVRKVYMIR